MPQMLLSGKDWLVKGYYGDDWRWRDAHRPVNRDPHGWYAASVPGTIQHDVWQAGDTPNPYFERNSLLLEWIPSRTWVYRKTFTLDGTQRDQRVRLRFEGVDYAAQFFLNGHHLGGHEGMYTPAVFEVSDVLNFGGENVLAVVVEPSPLEQPQVGHTSRVQTHKSRMTYWWDFCPRMVHIGLWDDVFLDFSGTVRIADIVVRPQLSTDFQQANINITVALDALDECAVMAETTLYFGGAVITSVSTEHNLTAGYTSFSVTLPIKKPRLWYPNSYGEQPLYEANVHLVERDDSKLDRCTTRFGIRSVEIVPNDTDDPTARAYTFVVNGQRIYIKGWNWVPMDVMYGVPRPAKLMHLLTLAQQAHVNLLRVWGGGLIEKAAFYERCDELGIMVWQEFILSSSGIDNNPSTHPDFIAMMVREAQQIIPRKRHHPSLVLWCGGNELTGRAEQPLDSTHPLLAALKEVVERLDPDRLWLPTSPTGRVFSNSLANIEHDPSALHDTHGPWEYQGVTAHYTLYNRGSSLLHSEFGVEGLTNLKTLNATIAPEHQWPVTLANPIWHHLGAWWVKETMWRQTFGDIDNIKTLVRATQLIQADGLRYALEADRRRKYQSSGTLPWQFNEPYPMAACTSAVDYYGQPKPAYYAVKKAYAVLHLSAQFETSAWAGRDMFRAVIWGHNSAHKTRVGQVKVVLMRSDGTHDQHWTLATKLAPDSAQPLLTIECSLETIGTDVFFLDLTFLDEDNSVLSSNRYSFTRTANLAPLLAVPPTTLKIEKQSYGMQNGLTITNTGDTTALFVWLEDDRVLGALGNALFQDNHFCLQPQEVRTIQVIWQDVPAAEQRLRVRGWNTCVWQG